jgi:hypothetical protein
MADGPQSLGDQVKRRGFVLVNGDNGVYTAVLTAPVDPEVSAGSPQAKAPNTPPSAACRRRFRR